jgi:hypothetical protein
MRDGFVSQDVDMTDCRKKSDCPYAAACHFYNITTLTPHTENMRDIYCEKWPERCAIHGRRAKGLPVRITLWPSGQEMRFA